MCYEMKEASLKWLQVHNSNFMIFWKRQNYGDSKKKKKKSAVTRSSGEGRDENVGGAEGIFRSVELLHETGIVDICHLMRRFSKLKDRTAQRVSPCVNYGLVLIII